MPDEGAGTLHHDALYDGAEAEQQAAVLGAVVILGKDGRHRALHLGGSRGAHGAENKGKTVGVRGKFTPHTICNHYF